MTTELIHTEKPLTKRESSRFERLEKIIRNGLQTFYDVGKALMEIREARLYREKFPTFELYCRDRWGMTKTHANRHILAYQAADRLAPIGAMPAKESQVRPLTKLDPEKQLVAWETAMREAGGPEKVTASLVSGIVDDLLAQGKAKVISQPKANSRYINHTRLMKHFAEAIEKNDWTIPRAALRWLENYK